MWTFFVRNLRFTIIVTLAIAILGAVSMITIDKESNPEVQIPFVMVATPFLGASALDVEQFVTNPLEDALSGIDELKQITSTSSQGFSSIGLEFEIGSDIDKKLREVQEAITLKRSALPTDAGDTIAQQVSFDDRPVKVYAVGGPYSSAELKRAVDTIVDRLGRVPGLTEARLIGGEDREIRVLISPAMLQQSGVSIDQVANALRQAETSIPVGVIERNEAQYSVRLDGRLKNIEELALIPITARGESTVLLGDIATIVDGYEEATGFARLYKDGVTVNALTVQIVKKSGGNVLNIVDAADKVFEDAREDVLPEGVIVESVDDDAAFIRTDLVNLARSGLQTTVIVVLLILILLGWREALLAGLSIPLTFLIAFCGLSVLGYTLNFLSLFSLILALGILVDSGIVMTEGMYENRMKGMTPVNAAITTINEFKAPLIAGTVTTVFAFLPMMLTSGIIGEFIKSIPVTVSLVLFASLFVAIALIPSFFVLLLNAGENRGKGRGRNWTWLILLAIGLAFALTAQGFAQLAVGTAVLAVSIYEYRTKRFSTVLKKYARHASYRFSVIWKKMEARRDAIVNGIRTRYQKIIERFLRDRTASALFFVTLGLAFVAAIALPVTGLLKVDMFPPTDMDRVYIDVAMPAGSSLERTNTVMTELESYFRERSEVESYLMTVGSGSSLSGASGASTGSMTLNLVDRKERPDSRDLNDIYTNDLREVVVPGRLTVQSLSGGPEQGSAIEVKIVGEDLAILEQIALEWEEIIKNIDGTRNVQTSIEDTPGEIAFTFKREQLGTYGVVPIQIASILRSAVFGNEAISIREGDKDIPVMVKIDIAGDSAKDIRVEQLLALPITTARGTVPLSTLVDSDFGVDRSRVIHEDGERLVRVTAGTAKGVVPQTIFEAIQAERESVIMPEGYELRLGGQNEEIDQSFSDLGRAMFLGIFMIAALLVWQFNSYRQPIMIISSIPMSLIGVLPGLALVGQPLSFPGMIGVVALAGIVVNNGIILVDRINDNRRSGMSRHDAVVDACSTRLRPIVLTTITTVAGLLPLALSEPSWAPLGFAIIFGLLFSTVLTLVSLPLLYVRFAEENV